MSRAVWMLGLLCTPTLALGATTPKFANVTESWGVEATHVVGPYTVAAGTAIFDWDDDGFLDIYVAGGLTPNRLYRNLGADGPGFEDVTYDAGLSKTHIQNLAAVAADFRGRPGPRFGVGASREPETAARTASTVERLTISVRSATSVSTQARISASTFWLAISVLCLDRGLFRERAACC